MMLFTLKILRFIFRLILKVVLFPFRLVLRLAGMRTQDDELEAGGGPDSSSETTIDSETAASAASSSGGSGIDALDVDAETARTNINRFRTGLLVLGSLQLLLIVVGIIGIAGAGIGSAAPIWVGFLMGGAVAIIPILIGFIPSARSPRSRSQRRAVCVEIAVLRTDRGGGSRSTLRPRRAYQCAPR